MVTIIKDKRDAIAALCRRFGVVRLYVFGSAVRDDFRPGESDVDLVMAGAVKSECSGLLARIEGADYQAHRADTRHAQLTCQTSGVFSALSPDWPRVHKRCYNRHR